MKITIYYIMFSVACVSLNAEDIVSSNRFTTSQISPGKRWVNVASRRVQPLLKFHNRTGIPSEGRAVFETFTQAKAVIDDKIWELKRKASEAKTEEERKAINDEVEKYYQASKQMYFEYKTTMSQIMANDAPKLKQLREAETAAAGKPIGQKQP